MSEPTRKNDIIESGVLDEFIRDVKKAKQGLEKYDAELRKTAQTMKGEFDSANKQTIQGMEKISRLQKKAEQEVKKKRANQKTLTTLEREEAKLLKQKERLIAQESKSYKKLEKDVNNLKEAKKRKAKSDRDEAKQMQRNTNAYTKLSDASRRYKNESKTLGAELLALEQAGKKNSRVWNETNKRYTQVTAKAKTTDAQLKKLDATVGDNQRSVGNYANATRKLTGALASLGIAVGVGQIFRNVGGIIADFDQAVTDLGAISGKTAEELAPLNKQARELGATTQFSATEVTGLQIELAKLGFTTQEIMDSTGGIANFAAATGVEIPRAAALAGSSLRAFGLDATEIDRVVSTLGVATTKTALDFSKLENGLSTVAPVAKSFGFSIEDTTALLGQLANSGFDASSAATATRNILLNLADANGDLAKQLGRPIKSADDLAAGLAELQAKGIDLGEALELTDKRSVAAFQTFLDGSGDLVELRDSITDVNGELTDMANKRLDSVGGAMKLLNSAWEGFILNLNESIGASDAFQSVIKFVAANLGTIIGTVAKLVAGFLAYKTALIAINIQQKIAGKGIAGLAKQFFTLGKNAKGAAGQTSRMGKALKGIGWAALIAVAIELAVAFYDIASGVARARKEEELYAEFKKKTDKQINTSIERNTKLLDKNLEAIRRRRELGEITEKEALKQSELATAAARDRIQEEQKSINQQIKSQEKILALNKKAVEIVEEASGGFFSADQMRMQSDALGMLGLSLDDLGGEDVINNISEAEAQLKALREASSQLNGEQENLNGTLEEFGHQLEVNNREKIQAKIKGLNDTTEAAKRLKLELKDIDALLNEGQTLEQIEDEEIGQENDKIQRILSERLTMINDAERAGTLTAEEAQDQREIMQLEALLEQKKVLERYGRDTVEIDREISEQRLQISKQFTDKELEELDARNAAKEQRQKEALKMLNDTQRAITDALSANIDERISLMDREANAAKEQQDYLQGLAEQGSIEAGQSITEEREREIAALREKERLEKQKATLELISSALEVFSTSLEEGASPQEALAQTVLTTGALTEFLSGLNFFAEGTDNAPSGLAVVDEEGGEAIFSKSGKLKELGTDGGARLTKLAAGDRVLTAPETMDWMRQSAMMNQISPIKQDTAGNSYDLLGKKLDNVERAIKNQPTNDWSVEEAAKNVMNLIKTTKQDGDKRVSKYRVKY